MKKAFATIAALVIFVGFSTLTFAQDQQPAEPPATPAVEQKAPEQAAPPAEPKAEVKAEVIEGTIASINAEAKSIVVKVKEGKKNVEKTVAVEDLTGLKAGEKVKVTLKADDPTKAEKVEAVAPAKSKVKKGKKGGK
jgi:hypothetical protein